MEHYDLQQAREHFAARIAYTTGVHELEVLIIEKGFRVESVAAAA